MGLFKLGKMTFGSLFRKPETVLYPLQTKPQPAGLKGHIAIDVEACILCGMCDRSCSTDCITVDKTARTWEIDRFQCVQCGYCITVCPKKCLSMDPNYAPAATSHSIDRIVVPESEKPAKKVPEAGKGGKAADKGTVKATSQAAPAKGAGASSAPGGASAASAGAVDEVLEAKIALMDPDAAERVRAALAAR